MADVQGREKAFSLVSRILLASGVLFMFAGAFLILFVNTTVGIVLLIAGLTDLVMSVILPKLTGGQRR